MEHKHDIQVWKVIFVLVQGAIVLSLMTGCAFLNRDNTPLLNAVEQNMWPEQTSHRWLAAPVVVPLGATALAADAFVVHPLSVVDDAARDTGEALWDDWDWEDEYVTECAGLPWRAVFTPPCYACIFMGRALFDVDHTADDLREQERRRRDLQRLEQALDRAAQTESQGNGLQALDELATLEPLYRDAERSLRVRYYDRLIEQVRSHAPSGWLTRHQAVVNRWYDLDHSRAYAFLCQWRDDADPLNRLVAYQVAFSNSGRLNLNESPHSDENNRLAREREKQWALQALADSEPAIAQWMAGSVWFRSYMSSALKPQLYGRALASTDPAVRMVVLTQLASQLGSIVRVFQLSMIADKGDSLSPGMSEDLHVSDPQSKELLELLGQLQGPLRALAAQPATPFEGALAAQLIEVYRQASASAEPVPSAP